MVSFPSNRVLSAFNFAPGATPIHRLTWLNRAEDPSVKEAYQRRQVVYYSQNYERLFDHFVGAGEQRWRDR
jgi:hypothetical protein